MCILIVAPIVFTIAWGYKFEEQLYEDLFYNYNKIARPVVNGTDLLTIMAGAALIRIIQVDEKNQVLTTNIWSEYRWKDAKLNWEPGQYGGIKRLHIPTDDIWTPDVILYNQKLASLVRAREEISDGRASMATEREALRSHSPAIRNFYPGSYERSEFKSSAAGHPEINIYTDAFVYYDGTIVWRPPAIYKSFCAIDVTWFPFDSQICQMKFGIWTYTGDYIDMKQLPEDKVLTRRDGQGKDFEYLEQGMDISYYYQRKHLFFTVNLIVPCFLISFLTTFIFFRSEEKITMAISMLLTLIVFFLVLIDIIPPTSLVIPMFGRYLLTTMTLVSLSIVISVMTVNFNYKRTETMPHWIRIVFLRLLPKLLFMQFPTEISSRNTQATSIDKPPPRIFDNSNSPFLMRTQESPEEKQLRLHKQILHNVLLHIKFIADHFRVLEEEERISTEWTMVSMVMDRLFVIIFAILNVCSAGILIQAPSLYDDRQPLQLPLPHEPLALDTLERIIGQNREHV